MARLTSICNTVSNKIKLGKSHFLSVQGTFWSYLIISSFSFSLQGPYLQGEIYDSDYESFAISETSYVDFEGRDRAAEHTYLGSCCKKPIQGPPGPALNNYISAFYLGPAQLVTAPNTNIPLLLNNIRISDGWVLAGNTFTNTQSGIYLVSYNVGMFSENTDPHDIHVTVWQNGVELLEGHTFVDLSTRMLAILSATFLVSYTAGDTLAFFFDANSTDVNMGGNAIVTITRIQ